MSKPKRPALSASLLDAVDPPADTPRPKRARKVAQKKRANGRARARPWYESADRKGTRPSVDRLTVGLRLLLVLRERGPLPLARAAELAGLGTWPSAKRFTYRTLEALRAAGVRVVAVPDPDDKRRRLYRAELPSLGELEGGA